jgi:dTDP-4-dehydrorhamnose reductase
VVDDIINNYLWVGDASDGILAAIHRNQNGLFHAGGSESTSRYAFSLRVAAAFDYDPGLISPCSSTQFHALVPRPKNTTCSTKRLHERLGIVPLGIDEGLAQMKNAAERYCGNGVLEQEDGIARSRAAVEQGPVK